MERVERYLAHCAVRLRPKTLREITRHLRRHAAPLHQRELAEIDRRTVATLLGEIEAGSGAVSRNRVRTTLSAFWSWAIAEGLAETNPVTGTNTAPEQARDRVLTPAELGALWRCLGNAAHDDIVRLLILTGQRREEIGGLRWSEVVSDMIVLPPARTKNGRQHVVPLSPITAAILERQPRNGEFVFGNKGSWSDAKARLDARLPIAPWRLHDLRRTCATGMAELGVAPHVIEEVLNHVSGHKGGVAGIYNRATYTAEVRAALERWADWVDGLMPSGATSNSVEPTNVVALRQLRLSAPGPSHR